MIDSDIPTQTDLVEIFFPAGLPGFPNERSYLLSPWGGEDSPFMMLSSTEDLDVGFVVVEPWVFYPDYDFDLDRATSERLSLSDVADAIVVCVVTLGDKAEDATINLLGPIVINKTNHEACQAVLTSSGYDVRASLTQPK